MSKRLTIIRSVLEFLLVAWYWLLWPLLSYLELRGQSTLGAANSAWDVWKSLVVGPLDAGSRPPNASAVQLVLYFGNWLFGYVVLAIALSQVGRKFENRRDNHLHVSAYGVVAAVILVSLSFGGVPRGTTADVDFAETVTSEIPPCSEPGLAVDEREVEWKGPIVAQGAQVAADIGSAAEKVSKYQDRFSEEQPNWDPVGDDARESLSRAYWLIEEMMGHVRRQRRPKRCEDLALQQLNLLQEMVSSSIRDIDGLGDCKSDCERLLNDLVSNLDEADAKTVLP